MQTNVVGTPPATLEAAGTLIVDVVCSAESADLTAATMEARPKRQRTARLERESDAMGSQTSFAEEGGTSGMAPIVKVGSHESSGKKPTARLLVVLCRDMLRVQTVCNGEDGKNPQ